MMKRKTFSSRPILAGIAVLTALTAGLATPFYLASDRSEVVLNAVAVMAADRWHYEISQPLRLSSFPNVVVESGTISVAGAQSGKITGQSLANQLSKGTAKLVLTGGRIAVVAGKPPEGGEAMPASILAPLTLALSNLKFAGVVLKDCDIVIHGTNGATDELANVDAVLKHDAQKTVFGKGSFLFRGQQLTFDGSLGIAKAQTGEQQFPIKARIAGDLIQASLSGELVPGNGGRLMAPDADVKIPDIGKFARWLGIGWPEQSVLTQFRGTGALDWSNHLIAFNSAVLRLDDSKATGALSVKYGGERPEFDATLAFGSLDLTRFLGPAPEEAVGAIAATASAVRETAATVVRETAALLPEKLRAQLGGAAVPLARQVDADFRISADSVKFGDVVVGRSAAAVSLRNGRMLADLAEIELPEGGRGSLQISFDFQRETAQCAVRGKLEGFEVGHVLRALTGRPVLMGRGDITIDVSGEGRTLTGFVADLDGKAAIVIANGGRLGVRLDSLTGLPGQSADNDPESAVMLGANDVKRLMTTGLTDLQDVDIAMTFLDGSTAVDRFAARASDRSLVGRGHIDLRQERLDLGLWIDGRAQAADPAVRSGTLVNVSGTWDSPSLIRRRYPSRAASPMSPGGLPAGGVSPSPAEPVPSTAPAGDRG